MSESDKSSSARDTSDSGPIDVAFEPAEDRGGGGGRAGSGPGWFALAIASVLAAGAGGLVGATVSGQRVDADALAPVSVVEDMDILTETQRQMEETLADLRADLEAAEERYDRTLEGIMSGTSGTRPGLAALSAELGAIQQRLDQIETGGVLPVTPGDNVDTVSSFDELTARLDRIERADLSEEAGSPRLLNRAVTDLRDRVATVEKSQLEFARALQARTEAFESLQARVNEAEAAMDVAGLDPDTIAAEFIAIRAEIDALKSGLTFEDGDGVTPTVDRPDPADITTPAPTGPQTNLADAALAISAIESAARRGRPFAAAFDRLERALPGDRAVAALADIAETGAPTIAELRTAFREAEQKTIESAGSTPKGDGWDWLRRAGDGMVTVRRTDGEGEGTLAALTRAGNALAENDLDAAIEAVESLEGAAAEGMAGWLADAKDRRALEDGLDMLRLRMIELQP